MSLLLLFSVFLLLRGHHEPGGGFVGGLVASGAFGLYALAFDVRVARQTLHVDPRALLGVGLLVAMGSGFVSVALGRDFMTGTWAAPEVPLLGVVDLGTPLLFDVGVYLVVLGTVLTFLFTLEEEGEER